LLGLGLDRRSERREEFLVESSEVLDGHLGALAQVPPRIQDLQANGDRTARPVVNNRRADLLGVPRERHFDVALPRAICLENELSPFVKRLLLLPLRVGARRRLIHTIA
jgi:hypothetical protein